MSPTKRVTLAEEPAVLRVAFERADQFRRQPRQHLLPIAGQRALIDGGQLAEWIVGHRLRQLLEDAMRLLSHVP